MSGEEISGALFRAYRPEPGYIRCDHTHQAEVDGAAAREALDALATLTDGAATPLLVDLREVRSVSREARRTFSNSQVPTRLALYVESSLSRTLANFFIGVARPEVPTKVFTNLDDAREWLLHDG